jgi:hypothetical protein
MKTTFYTSREGNSIITISDIIPSERVRRVDFAKKVIKKWTLMKNANEALKEDMISESVWLYLEMNLRKNINLKVECTNK